MPPDLHRPSSDALAAPAAAVSSDGSLVWKTRRRTFRFPRPAVIMGILNVTPDSFSDGGKFFNVEAAVARGLAMVKQGAEILDIGGESTRPGAAPVPEAEELRRVIPVVEALSQQTDVALSIDTLKPAVAEAAIRAGASIVNDVAASRDDEAMWRVVAAQGAGYVAMHMQGTPQTMQGRPNYRDVVSEVADFFLERLDRLERAGVGFEQIVLDVGIGFGKTPAHNLQLLGAMRRFARVGRPLVLGVSRKSFLTTIAGAEHADGLPGSLACAVRAVEDGVQILRVHDVNETRLAVRTVEAILEHRRSEA